MIDHAQLHPYGLCAGRDGGVHGLARRLRTAEDVHHVDSHAQLRQLAPDIFAVNMLSGDLRVDGDDAIAMVLQRLHRSEEHTSELQSLMRISYAVFCLKKKKKTSNKSIQKHIQITHSKTEQQELNR